VLTLPPSVRIFLACGATDLRKSYDGLCGAIVDVLLEDPFSGFLFGFANRRRNRVKLIVWDHGGFWLFCRRLEEGTFDWPRDEGKTRITMTSRDLLALLEGLDLSTARWRKRYERPVSAS
jgi:transposase